MPDDVPLESPVIDAIARISDHRQQNLVMDSFIDYHDATTNLRLSETDKNEYLASILRDIRAIAENGIETGDERGALLRILQQFP
jgi:hypothetical protein